MRVYPNCKINLGLNIIERRPDGYHNLQTIFYPIPLCDELTIDKAQEDQIEVTGIKVDGDPMDNLVMKAVFLLREKGMPVPPVKIKLNKNIPNGAGLGGGSSDAAFTIKALNEMFKLNMSTVEMEHLISKLGADCAVFIQNKPVYAEGIGNIFKPINLDLPGWHLILIKPSDFVSTKEAYAMIQPNYPEYDINEIIKQDPNTWKGKLVNDFERSVFPQHPTIESIRNKLYDLGATYASMSGSGSSVFGIFQEIPNDIDKIFTEHFRFQCTL